MSCKAKDWPAAVKMLRPFSVVSGSGRPRMVTAAASPPPRSVTWMPVTRWSASTTLLSGNLPTSSATIASTICVDSLRTLSAPTIEARTPVTMISSSTCEAVVSASAASCARATPDRLKARMDAVQNAIDRNAIVKTLPNRAGPYHALNSLRLDICRS